MERDKRSETWRERVTDREVTLPYIQPHAHSVTHAYTPFRRSHVFCIALECIGGETLLSLTHSA